MREVLLAAAVLLKHSLLHLGWLTISLPDSKLTIVGSSAPFACSFLCFAFSPSEPTEHRKHHALLLYNGYTYLAIQICLKFMNPKNCRMDNSKTTDFHKGLYCMNSFFGPVML